MYFFGIFLTKSTKSVSSKGSVLFFGSSELRESSKLLDFCSASTNFFELFLRGEAWILDLDSKLDELSSTFWSRVFLRLLLFGTDDLSKSIIFVLVFLVLTFVLGFRFPLDESSAFICDFLWSGPTMIGLWSSEARDFPITLLGDHIDFDLIAGLAWFRVWALRSRFYKSHFYEMSFTYRERILMLFLFLRFGLFICSFLRDIYVWYLNIIIIWRSVCLCGWNVHLLIGQHYFCGKYQF